MAEMLAGVPTSQTALHETHLTAAGGVEECVTTWFLQSVDFSSV